MYTKSQRMVILFSGWVLIVLVLLTALQVFDSEYWQGDGQYGSVLGIPIYDYQVYFFILCFIGFLIIVETTGPFTTRPRWKSRVNALIIIGLIIFAVIVFVKVENIIAPGLLS
jgi:hypothetical protein